MQKSKCRGTVEKFTHNIDFKEEAKNACTYEDTLAAFGIYSMSSIDLDRKINGRVRASSINSSLENMEIVAQRIKISLKSRKIRPTSDPKPA